MTLTIMTIGVFVNKTFESQFSKYVDDSNKSEVNHLVFDLKNVYKDSLWDIETIKSLGEDAISKGIALEIYDVDNTLIWSIFKDEKMLSNKTLTTIKHNMKTIDQNWNGELQEYKFDIYDDNENLVGYEKIVHYDSIYYMENDIEFINIMNKFMLIISILSLSSIMIISIVIAKSISNPIEKVSSMSKVIEKGNYKERLSYISNIQEVDELINSINTLGDALNDQEILRKNLTTDIAHELRTPITSVQGHLDAIIDGIWDPTPDRLISIREEVSRIGTLIGELKNLANFDNEKNKLNKNVINIKYLIQNILYNYESKALNKNINVH
ncbi:MAG: histidine kinase dimerization/phospho-acceptor domain-containing protein, partial [Paraclostridium sp.]